MTEPEETVPVKTDIHVMATEIAEHKMKKSRSKAAYTRARNKLRDYLDDDDDEFDKNECKRLLDQVEEKMDDAAGCVQELCQVYVKHNKTEDLEKATTELELYDEQYNEVLDLYHATIKKHMPKTDKMDQIEDKKRIGHDLWQQLQRVTIPTFYGDKSKYPSWKAAFYSCVDAAPSSSEYKLLQLHQYLGGEALAAIENLGHSADAYDAAKQRLERKFGGSKRVVHRFLDQLENFQPIRNENVRELEKYADILDVAVINLKEIGHVEDLTDGSLYHRLLKKLSQGMLTRYNRYIYENDIKESVESLREWINKETDYAVSAKETIYGLTNENPKAKQKSFYSNNNQKNAQTLCCKVCGGEHKLWRCEVYRNMNIEDRWAKAKEEKLCFRCLKTNHVGQNCKFHGKCGINGCEKTHNRLLHRENSQTTNGQNTSGQTFTNSRQNVSSFIALRTLPVLVCAKGKEIQVNALLDDGSTKTYINQDVAEELGLDGKFEPVNVTTLNGRLEKIMTKNVKFELKAIDRDVVVKIEANTTRKVTGNLKPIEWNYHKKKWNHLKEIQFSTIGKRQKIDILIGLDYADLHKSLGELSGEEGSPTARLTPLGWTCVGPLDNKASDTCMFTFHTSTESTSDVIKKFWEIEELPLNEKVLSRIDQTVIKETEKSIKYDAETRKYEIGVPWKENKDHLENNYDMALKRLENTEKKLSKNPEVKSMYEQVIKDYVNKEYVTKINSVETNERQFYLPHFPVIKLNRETTKVRLVFDASAKYKGLSLNDTIHQGPSLQTNLFDILTRFRSQAIALVCDIKEMYLQIGIPLPDRVYHRFLWRNEDEVEIYEWNRVVFGVNASPFLAQFISQYNARKYAEEFPKASEVVLKNTYMDDSITSVATEEDGVEMYYQLSELWKMAGMNAHKWISNSQAVLEHVPITDRAFQTDLCKEALPSIKTLGILWSAETDEFKYKYKEVSKDMKMTKRSFFSKVATLYDPLGFVSPFTIRAKILMQDLWLSGIDWDDEVTEELDMSIWKWFDELKDLDRISIERTIDFDKKNGSEIHTFVDASSQAYAAIVYVRNCRNDNVKVHMVASKSKVAPLKALSIPRLELMAAVLGMKLTKTVCEALNTNLKEAVIWSDSLNVLYWIRNQSRQFKPFVANTLGEIHTLTEPQQWRYVPTKENPADTASRGQSVSDLVDNKTWWEGPQFLKREKKEWPKNRCEPDERANCEKKVKSMSTELKAHSFVTMQTNERSFRLQPNRYSNWKHYVRVFAWTKRFIENCRVSKSERNMSKELQLSELQTIENSIIQNAQVEAFKDEYYLLKKGKRVSSSSKLLQLNPVLDEESVMRCNSRLRFVEHLSYESKYPIILPRRHYVTNLIVRHYHQLGNHCGTNQTLSLLSSRYWIISAREVIREIENECRTCRRLKEKVNHQMMGPLPSFRTGTYMRAFSETAVDYAGPFMTKQGRGKSKCKRYLCLFTCMSSRAVHLEMAYSLETDTFLNAFYRFVNRRGLPKLMLSDNGTNFVGAVRELKELKEKLDNDKIVKTAANQGIEWKFIPPGTPHFGGVHESMIKSAKRALYNILGNADISDEELHTAFTGAEGLMNSRPLTYQSSNPADNCVLTPNHFLIGQLGGEFAPESVDTQTFNIKKRWRRVQELVNHFWSRWFREFLPTLSARKKWQQPHRDFKRGDVVMIIDPDATRGNWTLGRVQETHPGADGHVRVATVTVGNKMVKKPTHRLCLLEEENLVKSDES